MNLVSRAGLLAFVAAISFTGLAHSFVLDQSGGVSSSKVPPPKVIPQNHCVVGTYGAFANPSDSSADSYMLSGPCDINVSPSGKDPVLQHVNVQIEAEWSPILKRASETVKVFTTDKTITFSTWATCTTNPFIVGAPDCRDQGFGGDDVAQLFLRKEDIPFGRRKVAPEWAAKMTARVSSRAQIRQPATIGSVAPSKTTLDVGDKLGVWVNFAGGAGSCPMDIDFGDGYTLHSFYSQESTRTGAEHAYAKPGTYTVKTKTLPGCVGGASTKVTVVGSIVESIRGNAHALPGQPAGILVGGRHGVCRYEINYGDGSKEVIDGQFPSQSYERWTGHTYVTPGHKNITVRGVDGCSGIASGGIDIDPAAVKKLDRTGKLDDLETFKATATGGVCPMHVDWGDGTSEDLHTVVLTNGQVTLTHRYKTKGRMLVSARGIDGCVGIAGAWAQVN